MSESAFDWQQEGFIRRDNEPVRIFFSCREPKPPYAGELISALHEIKGNPYRSRLEDSIAVSVTDQMQNADAVVTFYVEDEGLRYALVIPGVPEMGGWFCDDDHVS